MRNSGWLLSAVCLALVPALAPAARDLATFGVHRQATPEAARAQAADWLKSVGLKPSPDFEAIWATDRSVLDRVADTLALGSPEAARILAEARDPAQPAPKSVPAILKDPSQASFFRANLALAYAKALSSRRIYEETLAALSGLRPEQVVDPASFFFYKAVAEHGLLRRKEALTSLSRLLDDVAEVPERQRMVAALMVHDMKSWADRDLGEVGRLMRNIERRLDLSRGGPETQRLQREVVDRLDELIRRLDRPSDLPFPKDDPNDRDLPRPEPRVRRPMDDSRPSNESGPGVVDGKKWDEIVKLWGKFPEKDRVRVMTELVRDLPPVYRQMIEDYYRKLAQGQ